VDITKWLSNQVNQIIGTIPLEDFNDLAIENKTPISVLVQRGDSPSVETHSTNTEEKLTTTTRISLSSEEKMFIEHTIFSAPLYTTRNEILDLIVDGIPSISGVKREKSTIKYYIYDGVERKKPGNRPYRLIFGLKRYSAAFKQQAIQEADKLGQKETQLKFALPFATLDGWLDKQKLDSTLQKQDELDAKLLQEEQEQTIATEGESPSSQTVENILQQNTTSISPSWEIDEVYLQAESQTIQGAGWRTTKSNPADEKATEILNTLVQIQSNNRKLADKVRLHITALATAKKQLIADFEVKEKSCDQLINMVTATEANIEAALNILVKVESATQKTKKVRGTTITNLEKINTKLRKESGTLKLHQEQMQRDLQEVVRNIPKIK